jgi:nicotinamide-nucleotide amidase
MPPLDGGRAPTVDLIAIGDELVHGITVDTNSAWLARRLEAAGLSVRQVSVVGDGEDMLQRAVEDAAGRSEVVVMTGGLGPTDDDRTRIACAKAAGVGLAFHEPSWKHVQAWFRLAKRPMPETNRRQAELPEGADVLDNRQGTAPGFAMDVGGARVFALPGVPREMKAMFDAVLLPELQERFASRLRPLTVREVHVLGPGEAALGERISDLMTPSPTTPRAGEPSTDVGITARDGVLTVRIVSSAADEAASVAEADRVEQIVRGRVEPAELLYVGPEPLAERVQSRLLDAGCTLTVAESCTGGLLAGAVTEQPGSSAVFPGGFVTYANEAKSAALGVDAEVIRVHGAVSEPVVQRMSQGAAARMGADYAVAISGVAGPDGGTEDKPVGMVCFGLHDERSGTTTTWTRRFPALGRAFVRRRAVVEALAAVLRAVDGRS